MTEKHRTFAAPSTRARASVDGERQQSAKHTEPARPQPSSGFALGGTARGGQPSISHPDDAVERDADRLADRIAPRDAAGRGSRPAPPAAPPGAVWDAIDAPGRPLAADERLANVGIDLSTVRVHTGGRASDSARALGAAAFAVGDEIVLGDGYKAGTTAGRRLLAHELAHVVQQRTRPGPPLVRRDLAIEPPRPSADAVLTDAAAADAVAFNSRTITDPDEIGLLRDILGLDPAPAVADADFVRAVATYQAGQGLLPDGKVGPTTRRRLSLEILAETKTLAGGDLGSLATGMQLRTDLTALIAAGTTTYADYRDKIRAATLLQRDVCLADMAFLSQLRGQLSWNSFARCVELLGRRAPTLTEMTSNRTVQAAIAGAWGASNVAVNPPVADQHEEGGWVYLNLLTNELSTRRQAAGAQAAIDLSAPPVQADSVVVGKFHTHPNLGPVWLATASPKDIKVDAEHGVPDIVVATTGINPAVFTTFPSGPDRRLHLAGDQGLPGLAGGLAPQAKADGTEDDA